MNSQYFLFELPSYFEKELEKDILFNYYFECRVSKCDASIKELNYMYSFDFTGRKAWQVKLIRS